DFELTAQNKLYISLTPAKLLTNILHYAHADDFAGWIPHVDLRRLRKAGTKDGPRLEQPHQIRALRRYPSFDKANGIVEWSKRRLHHRLPAWLQSHSCSHWHWHLRSGDRAYSALWPSPLRHARALSGSLDQNAKISLGRIGVARTTRLSDQLQARFRV